MNWFKHSLRYPSTSAPLIERGWTQESEEPWRKGHSIVLRLPFSTKAVAMGRWTSRETEDAFHKAAGIREIQMLANEIGDWG